MNDFFFSILKGINDFVGNWGVAIILFTILIRLLLTPFDMKSRVSMRRMSKLQPQLQALQKKYANDREKLNAKTAELYKKEHVNPLSSCLPMLLTWPILIIIFGAMRSASNRELLGQVTQMLENPGQRPDFEQFLWIKNLWQPDNLFRCAYVDGDTLKTVSTDLWVEWFENLQNSGNIPAALQELGLTTADFKDSLSATVDKIMSVINVGGSDYAQAFESTGFEMIIFGRVPKLFNGLMLLPALSAGSQILMTKITSMGQPKQEPAPGQPNTGKFMQIFFPLLSVYFCLTYTAAFALYWVVGNLASMAQTVIINKVLDNREKKAAGLVAGEGTVK